MDMDFAVSSPLVRRSRLISGFCPSTRTFAPRFLQTPPRGDSPCVITSPSPPSGWAGDFHPQAAEHAQRTTEIEPIAIIRQMAERFRDEQIAATLNRLGLRTGAGNTWNESRVRFAREYHQLPAIDPNQPRADFVTLREAAQRLNVSLTIVRRLIAEKILPASQVVICAPWQIPAASLDSEAVKIGVRKVIARRPNNFAVLQDQKTLTLPGL